jgi:hypothetical protein
LADRNPFREVVLWIFLQKDATNRLTTSIFINRINVLVALEGELLVQAGFSRDHSGVVKGMNNV